VFLSLSAVEKEKYITNGTTIAKMKEYKIDNIKTFF
jgi:hypothetical protein